MELIRDAAVLEWAVGERDRITDGPYRLSEEWVQQTGVALIAQMCRGRIDDIHREPLVRAARTAGVQSFIAILNEDPDADPTSMTYRVQPSIEELQACSDEFFGVNLLLLAESSPLVLLSTVDDFSILAGPPAAVEAFQPDRESALSEFRWFAEAEGDNLPVAQVALRMFERYAGRDPQRRRAEERDEHL